MDNISFEDFLKLDIRMGRVVSAERVEGADKLVKLRVDTGDGERTLVAGLLPEYTPEDMTGIILPVLCNLEPRKIRGELSRGMILAADDNGAPVLLKPARPVPPGTPVR